MSVVLPDWCELVRGYGPVLLVAPHGGRRPRVDAAAPPPNLKVNDIYTAELTRELAQHLRASALINHGCDRNTLDLNRVSQVRRRALWFLETLHAEIEGLLARHAQVEMLFVHGWNVGQAKCDIGVGASEGAGGVVVSDGARLTVTRGYLDRRVEPLRAALEGQGIATFIGVRYPASHPNNLLQLFAERPLGECQTAIEAQFAEWAGAGRLQALQLELGIPLRWPGEWRQRLMGCLLAHFDQTHPPNPLPLGREGGFRPGGEFKGRVAHPAALAPTRRAASLQFYDPAAGIGLLAGIGPIGPETTAARLLLFLGGQRVALFTGERTPPNDLLVEPLDFQVDGEVTAIRFAGPILHLDDGAIYLDLEAALAASALGEVAAHVRFARAGVDASGAEFGRVEGWIEVGGERRAVATGGYANAGAVRIGQRPGHTMLAADFGGGHGVLVNIGVGIGARVIEFRDGATRELSASVETTASAAPFELHFADAGTLRASPDSRMEILRGLGKGGYARVTFGTARFEWEGREGQGHYEYATLV